MKIQVDFYRASGKWYSGGEVEISDDTYLWSSDFKQQIVDNQRELVEGWQDYFTVVTDDLPGNAIHPSYRRFFKHLWPIGSFNGLTKGGQD